MDTKKIFTQNPFKIIISLISCVLWGSAFPVLKISYTELHIAQNDMNARIFLAGMRFFSASIILFLFIIFVMKISIKVSSKNMLKLLILGVFQTSLYYFLFYNGLAATTGMKGAIIGALEIFFTIIIAHVVYSNDKIDKNKIIGLALGFLGTILVNWGRSFELKASFKGEGFLILCALIGAVCSIYVKNFSEIIHPFIMTAWQMLFGSIVMLLFGYINMAPNAMSFTTTGWALLVYSAFLSAISFSLWFMLLKYNKAGEISLYRFMTPLSGAILSAIFIPGEKFTIFIILALILVIIGIVGVNKKNKNDGSNR